MWALQNLVSIFALQILKLLIQTYKKKQAKAKHNREQDQTEISSEYISWQENKTFGWLSNAIFIFSIWSAMA